jgi:choline kinase
MTFLKLTETVVDNSSSTRTNTGLEVVCVRDDTEYQLAKKVSDEDFESISIKKILPFDTWNYKILPK